MVRSTAAGKIMLVNWEPKEKNCFLKEDEYFLAIQVDSLTIVVTLQ